MLNGNQFRFAAFPPHFKKDEPVKAEVKLINTTNKEQSVNLTWTLFNWAGEREENKFDQKTEAIALQPNETKSFFYETTKATGSVSFLNVEAQYQDTKSILNIRFVRDGFDETRINFPSIMKYPLTKGEPNTLFSCLHSTNAPIVDDGELILTLKDTQGNIIHSYTYTGGVTGAMMGVKDDFTPQKTFSTFTLTATLKHKGKVVEEVSEKYSCGEIDPTLCGQEEGGTNGAGNNSSSFMSSDRSIFVLLVVILLFLLGFLGWKLWRDRKGNGVNMGSFLFAILVSGILLFGGISGAEAKSQTWNVSDIPDLCYFWDLYYAVTGWSGGLRDANVSITYSAQVLNMSAGGAILSDGAEVPVGTKLSFQPKPFQDSDISWFGTGGSNDSPFGTWRNKANAPSPVEPYYLGKAQFGLFLTDVYIPLSVHPPEVSVDHLGTAGLSCDHTKMHCTVTSPGTILSTIYFSTTYGKFYYAYYNSLTHSLIIYNKVPMSNKDSGALNMCAYGGNANGYPPYILNVPSQTISFSFTAVSPNQPPSVPEIKGSADMLAPAPLTGTTGSPIAFYLRASDPENGSLRYGIDWDNNGSVDQWVPGSDYTESGTPQFASKTWKTPGNYTFRVKAEDTGGSSSDWASHTIAISDAYTLSVTLSANPNSGNAPLNNVSLTATVGGTATGTPINYMFDCQNDGVFDHINTSNTNPSYTATNVCNYPTAGTYTAKVFVKVFVSRYALSSTATTTVTVNACTPTYTYSCLHSDVTCTESTCGQTLTDNGVCVGYNSCTNENQFFPQNVCIENGVSCSDQSFSCPACQKTGTNWREVAP